MAQLTVPQIKRDELIEWLKHHKDPIFDPAPEWLIKNLEDPEVLRRYAEASIALRAKELQLELEKLQTFQKLME